MSRAAPPGLALCLSALLAACGNHPDPQRVAAPTISVGTALAGTQSLARTLDDSPRSLDPQLTTDIPSQRVLDDLFEGLVTLSVDGRPVPGAAESWEHSADGRTWVFHLRPQARWSNGAPVTAADFVYSWRREVDPKTGAGYAQSLAPIVNALDVALGRKPPDALGAEATDAHTLTVHLVAPTPYLLDLMDQIYLYPVYGPALERYGDDWVRPGHLVGNGAFTLHENVIGNRITLEASPFYWDAAHVHLKSVVYYVMPDRAQAVLRYLAGDVQFTDSFAANQRPWLVRTLGEQVVNSPLLGIYMLAFNFNLPPFRDNLPLRQALILAVDRAALTRYLKYGMYEPADTLLPPLPGYQAQHPQWAATGQSERNALARRLYAQAGYSVAQPLRVDISTSVQGADERHSLEAVAAMWRAVLGAQVGVDESEFKVLLQNRELGVLPLFMDAWIGDFADPVNFLQLFHSGGSLNYGRYANARFDALLDRAAEEPDAGARYRLLEQSERLLNQDAAYVPIYYYATRHLIKPYVRGWRSNPLDRNLSRYMYILEHQGH
ncbi:MAG TPA: peptide ABC transporter substrate-binding protein [Steroidobacteraceae bacterium]